MKTAIQELFSKLEIEHPNLFNINTLEGRLFINDYHKFFELEKQQIIDAYDVKWVEYIIDGKDYYNNKFNK